VVAGVVVPWEEDPPPGPGGLGAVGQWWSAGEGRGASDPKAAERAALINN